MYTLFNGYRSVAQVLWSGYEQGPLTVAGSHRDGCGGEGVRGGGSDDDEDLGSGHCGRPVPPATAALCFVSSELFSNCFRIYFVQSVSLMKHRVRLDATN